MTVLNPKPIIARLEKDGPDVVRKKLAQGVYADFKVPLIKQWLKGEYAPPDAVEDVTAVVTESVDRLGPPDAAFEEVKPDDTVKDPDVEVTGPQVVDAPDAENE